jgi:hypothetical protein
MFNREQKDFQERSIKVSRFKSSEFIGSSKVACSISSIDENVLLVNCLCCIGLIGLIGFICQFS